MSVGGSKQSGTSSSNVTIPQFLEPFVRQSTDIAGTALGGLSDLIAPRTATEYTGPPIPLQGVNGPNGPVFVDPSQNAFVDAGGSVIAPFQDGTVPGLVQGNNNPVRVVGGDVFGQGSSGTEELFSMPQGEVEFGAMNDNLVAGFQPAQVAAQQIGIDRALSGELFGPAQQALSGIAGNGVDTSAITGLTGLGADPGAIAGLRERATPGLLSGTDTLQATSDGDFLFGGDGFNAAVDAAVRRATPGILSTFGSAGAGGATGGLAQAAVGEAAVDAFASQFAQERRNQLGAAGQLAGLDLAGGAQSIDALNSLGRLDLAGNDQLLGQALGGVDAEIAGQRGQIAASQLLPGMAGADIDLLSRIGNIQQEQQQAQLDAPRNALLQLLTAAMGGTPITSLLGENRRSQQQGVSSTASLDDLAQLGGWMAGGGGV